MKAEVRKLKAIMAKIAKKRDEMRKLLSEYEGLIDSVNTGCDEFDMALQSMETAIDYISEQV